MKNLPVEIVFYIASFLERGDLSRFRLAHRRLALITFPLISQRIAVLNIVDDLEELLRFLSHRGQGRHTEKLTILHGRWPICTFTDWTMHPLQLNEFLSPTGSSSARRQQAFRHYESFIQNETLRDTTLDLIRLQRIVTLLPRLHHLTISHVHTRGWKPVGPPKYLALRKRIWMAPFISDSLGAAAQSFLSLLPSIPSVHRLTVEGRLSPSSLNIRAPMTHITMLELKAVHLYDSEKESFLAMLHAFPNLKQLLLGFVSTDVLIPVDEIRLESLSKLHLRRLCTSDSRLLKALADNPKLELHLSDITLAYGHWDTFLHRVKDMGLGRQISLDGYMSGLDPTCVNIEIEGERHHILSRFLGEEGGRWPFRARWIASKPFYV
ncbi:hypothetical protein CNYM01_11247 [Colletotrichum nymphaeae SA-01]|uniref:F-box domain-containing protein n=1 Tax=Colletotrichum nymphaeae SA-01 TaxID=1460502 RepID=A0A135RY67_9PEZI|nr:hypothetical protein CNYM01_11247 [Colletotrichum nymphaeae SA-01]